MLARAFRRAGLKVNHDCAIRPRPQLSRGPAPPLGVSSSSGLFDVELAPSRSAADILARVNTVLPGHRALQTGALLERTGGGRGIAVGPVHKAGVLRAEHRGFRRVDRAASAPEDPHN